MGKFYVRTIAIRTIAVFVYDALSACSVQVGLRASDQLVVSAGAAPHADVGLRSLGPNRSLAKEIVAAFGCVFESIVVLVAVLNNVVGAD